MLVVPLAVVFLVCVAAAVSYGTTHFVRRLAILIGCVDEPDLRKLHATATPRLGGVAIVAGFAGSLMLLALHPHALVLVQKNLPYLFALLTSGSLIVFLGIYDDLFGSNAPKKFVVQTAAAALLVWFGLRFDEVSLAGQLFDLDYFGVVVTIVWVVGVINALNFIDGMDELATIVSLTIAAVFAVISMIRGDMFTLVIMAALAGSLAGFYPWNRAPARIFMGDSGSLFIGLVLAACSIARSSKSPIAMLVGGPMLALALPVVDTLLVMRGRFGGRESSLRERFRRMFNADRTHIHHILIVRYGSEAKAITYIWLLTLLFGVAAIATVIQATKWFGYSLGALTLIALIFIRLGKGRHNLEKAIRRDPNVGRDIFDETVTASRRRAAGASE